MSPEDPPRAGYSDVAAEQLDEIEQRDVDLLDDLVDICEDILDRPQAYRDSAAAINTEQGIRMRSAVPGRHPYKVFWSTAGPRIEAIFPYPS